jgi:hypothetical protein
LVQKSVLLKVSETPSLKLAPGASELPGVDVVPDDVDVVLDVPPHAARTIATTTSAPSTRRRLANFDVMVFSSQVSDFDTRTL